MSVLVNEEGIKKGMAAYGPKASLSNVLASCKWCYCTVDMHKGEKGKCKFCDQCQGFDTGTPTTGKPDVTATGGPQKQ